MAAKLRPLQKFVASLNGQKPSNYSKCKQIVQCSCGGMQRRTIQNHSTIFATAPEQNINWKPSAAKFLGPLFEQRRDKLSSYLAHQLPTNLPARYNSSDKQTDFEDIKLMLQHILEDRKVTTDAIEKQLGLLDVLFQHRLQHVDVSVVTEEAAKLTPADIYSLASDVFALQEKVGEEAAILSGPLFKHAAISGDLNAKYSYAQLLRTGQAGIDPDPNEAAAIFSELAKKGHPFAQFALAGMYYSGSGVKQNFETAYTLYQIAAENGVIQGYNMIGKMYFQGQSVKADFKKAFEHFKKGADEGDIGAYMSVAHCYSNGKGVENDYDEAFRYHKMAANKGHAPALYNMGTHYFSGRGAELDMKKAAEYFKKAADLGFGMAQVNLGNMYYHGLGVEKDWHAARALYKKVAPSHHNARLLLEELEAEMKRNEMKIED